MHQRIIQLGVIVVVSITIILISTQKEISAKTQDYLPITIHTSSDAEQRNEYSNDSYIYRYPDFSENQLAKEIEKYLLSYHSAENHNYKVESLEVDRGYFISIVSSLPKSVSTTSHMIYPDLLVIVGRNTQTDNWLIASEYDKHYNQILDMLPDTLFDSKEKKHLRVPDFTASNVSVTIPSLPWPGAESRKMTQGVHSSNSCCLDFAVNGGGEGTVYAADEGTRIYRNGTCVFYKKGDHSLIYQHINPTDIDNAPETVEAGDYIGRTSTSKGCGLNFEVSHHIHFGIWNTNATEGQSIIESSLNGWLVNYSNNTTSLTKGNTTLYVNDLVENDYLGGSCVPPSSGDWVISSDCTLTGNFTIHGDIHIQNSSSLIVTENSNINFDFINNKITILSGSQLYITNGSKIY
ncbi:MAG: Peptidase family M23 [candidate division WS6 bacterium OLB20]|uniref:Peptidase family M23 n=1 Tax=candidate division WS6 bacterium OLB20 TaxID=1617426 RepID=A0A136LYL5_9BACT|nr:MAG: Peptidase family M23 [candidate division WS6 bacterium OLB20]